jgi:hypothetical protein
VNLPVGGELILHEVQPSSGTWRSNAGNAFGDQAFGDWLSWYRMAVGLEKPDGAGEVDKVLAEPIEGSPSRVEFAPACIHEHRLTRHNGKSRARLSRDELECAARFCPAMEDPSISSGIQRGYFCATSALIELAGRYAANLR